jgi:hypothetical protein
MTEKGEGVQSGIEGGCFDNFSLDCFRNCECYYYWRIVQGVVKPGAKKTAASFGSSIHLALEHFYREGMVESSISEAVSLFVEEFKQFQDLADDKRTLGKGVELLDKYFQKYKREPFDVVATEVGGAVELAEYLYTFRIDLIVEWHSPKGIFGMDHKTTSSLGRLVAKPNNQITGYLMALGDTYPNLLGYIVNVIGVFKEDEEMDKTAPKVVSPKTGKLIYAKKEKQVFDRVITSRTRKEIEDWKKETLHLIHQIEECHERDIWPKRTGFCTAFASRCQFLDLCQSQDREILLPLLEAEVYKREFWVPFSPLASPEGDSTSEVEG